MGTHNDKIELKCCPFCGNGLLQLVTHYPYRDSYESFIQISCASCGGCSPRINIESEEDFAKEKVLKIIDMWNNASRQEKMTKIRLVSALEDELHFYRLDQEL